MATQGAEVQTDPGKGVGQIVSQRNYANPELDGKLNPYLQRWGFHWLDDLSFRVAGWMFYDGFLDYGPEQYANRAAQQQFHVQPDGTPWPHGAYQTEGYSLGQLIGMDVADVAPDFEVSTFDRVFEDIRSDGRPRVFETRVRTRDGRLVPVEISLNFVDHSGQGFVFGWFHDISERKRLEAAVIEAAAHSFNFR